jgi:hypothetical protein
MAPPKKAASSRATPSRATPMRSTRSRRGSNTVSVTSGTRQSQHGGSEAASASQAGLPSIQGAGSVSYGAPGMADLPQMLVYNPHQTLAETIEAGIQESEARTEAMIQEFEREHSSDTAPRRSTRGRSAESDVSATSAASTRAHTPARRGLHAQTLTTLMENEAEEGEETEEEISGLAANVRGGRPSTGGTGDRTASFVQERGTHLPRMPYTAAEPRHRRQTTVAQPSKQSNPWVYISALLLFFLLLLLSAIIGPRNLTEAIQRCNDVPIVSWAATKFCIRLNPHPWANSTDIWESIKEYHRKNYDSWVRQKEINDNFRDSITGIGKGYQDIVAWVNQSHNEASFMRSAISDITDRVDSVEKHLQAIKETDGPGESYYHRTNFFSKGLGAITLPHLSSATYNRDSSLHRRLKWILFWPKPQESHAALDKWTEPGDCWCGETTSRNRNWTQFAIDLPYKIYPSGVQIQHIPKTATLYPGSTPKDIQIWAFMPDKGGRETLTDVPFFFDKNKRMDGNLGDDWLQIHNLTYSIDDFHTQSFPLPFYPEYSNTGIKRFVVRAVSNHGAKDHTCFYRVVMHGKLAEKVAE